MELGLSLGDTQEPIRYLQGNSQEQQKSSVKKHNLSFCMALGLTNREIEKSHEADEENEDDDEDDSDDNGGEMSLQLSLLPVSAASRQISTHLQSLPWSSDNGSSEMDSSENRGTPAARGLDMNCLPPAVMMEEVSSANSTGSPFRKGIGMYRNGGGYGSLMGAGNKRNMEAAGNDVVEERESFRGSDDDDEKMGLNTRKKLRLSKEQSAFLEESFKEHHTLNPKQKLALANQLNLRPRQVEVWFQNRRARTKLKQTEVDCEYLKRCCETLTEENRRLHKELQDLRALTTSNRFYMQLPATTLTMCPSCERVATAPPPPNTAAAAANGKVTAMDPTEKASPFPPSRPRFYPFSQASTSPNQPQSS